ncbi:MAG: TetR/AcrR family transcriptional regulator [Polyangiaceae bacterium]|nr:TetR/AcrR family transcriptional regulator [Polyangiaceae bacterium]
MSRKPRETSRKKDRATPRARRTPEEARAVILEACQRLLVRDGPDAVGLKDVAAEAGVSHALVTHYFGSIDALVNEALGDFADKQRRLATERILEQPELTPRGWMEQFFAWGGRPETARILAYSFLKGYITSEDFFSRKQRGAKRVVDAIVARMDGTDGRPAVPREDIEHMILVVLAATHGYAIGRDAYWPSLGVDSPGEREDRQFFDRLADMIELYAMSRARV